MCIYIYKVSIIWTSMCIFLIDHKFVHAGGFAIAGALLSAPGLIHQETLGDSDSQLFSKGNGI